MNKLTENLINLIRKNPELPVMPMVDSDVISDIGYNRHPAKFGDAYVGEYIIYGDDEKSIYIKGRFGDEIELKKEIYYDLKDNFAGMMREEINNKLNEIVVSLWTPAIIVCIDPLWDV